MGRIHLFEFEDQRWFPSFLRDYGTDFLQFLANATKMYAPIVPMLTKVLEAGQTHQIVDLGSGGGGGWKWLNTELQQEVPDLRLTLTDQFPNLDAFERTQKAANNIEFLKSGVDARDVPLDLKGLRTLFLTFHHFKPPDARKILQNAIEAKQPIAVVEAQERSIPSILAMLLSPVSVLLTTPFIRPFKIGRLLFTYLIPIVPLFVLWDGVVSALRTYSVKEMQELVEELTNTESYDWEIGTVKSGPGRLSYLIGTVKSNK